MAEARLVGDNGAEVGKALGVVALRNPQLEIATFGIFFLQMLHHPIPFAFLVEVGEVAASVLHTAQNHRFGNDLSWGFLATNFHELFLLNLCEPW